MVSVAAFCFGIRGGFRVHALTCFTWCASDFVCLFALFQAENARLRYPEAEAEAPTAVKKARKSLLRRAIRKTYKTIKRIGSSSSSKRSSSTITTDNSAASANTTVGSAVMHGATCVAERDDSARFTTMRPVEPAESTFTFVDVE
jgi:hypothetical protein